MSCPTSHDRFGADQRAITSSPRITALLGSSLGLGPHSDGLWHTPIDSGQIRIAPGMWHPVENKPLEESPTSPYGNGVRHIDERIEQELAGITIRHGANPRPVPPQLRNHARRDARTFVSQIFGP